MIDFSCKHDRWIRNDDGTLSRMDEPYFKSWKLAEGTWRVLSSGDYSYLIEGDDEALAIDSGYGAGNIREYMQSLTAKPLSRIANTHDHFDHTAMNSYFDMAYMSEATRELATRPFPSFAGIDFPRDYPVTILKDGDTVPLKGRDLTAILIPDHAVGSMAFLDRKMRILFSGDEFMGPRKMLSRGLTSWLHSLERLAAVRSEFDIMYGGAFTVEADVVDRMLTCTKMALETGGEPMKGGPGGPGGPGGHGPHGPGGPHGGPGNEQDAEGRIIYDRMMPHPEDKGKPHFSSPDNLRRQEYEGTEVIFDITKIHE